MATLSSQLVSELLAKWQSGDEEALHARVPVVYNELRRLAHHYLQRELVLQVSPATVKREWTSARAWLHREMKRVAHP